MAFGFHAFLYVPPLYVDLAKDTLAAREGERLRKVVSSIGANLGLFTMMAAWLANPLCWAAALALLRGRWWAACGTGASALAAGLAALTWPFMRDWTLYPGYYVWLASMAVLAAAGIYRALWRPTRVGLITCPRQDGRAPSDAQVPAPPRR